jgi:hypothetical protein
MRSRRPYFRRLALEAEQTLPTAFEANQQELSRREEPPPVSGLAIGWPQ